MLVIEKLQICSLMYPLPLLVKSENNFIIQSFKKKEGGTLKLKQRMKLLSGTLPANSKLLSVTIPANSKLLSGTLPANNKLLSETLLANNMLLSGRVPNHYSSSGQ